MFSLWGLQLWWLTTTLCCPPPPHLFLRFHLYLIVPGSLPYFFSLLYSLFNPSNFPSCHLSVSPLSCLYWFSGPLFPLCICLWFLLSPSLPQICVPQLQVDGGWQRGLPCAPKSLYTPWFSSFWRHLDETGGQFWQTQADQQRVGWSRTCESKNPIHLPLLPLLALELASPRLFETGKIRSSMPLWVILSK